MSNDMSMEALYAMGTGVTPNVKTLDFGTENYDGYTDEFARGAESAMQDINFLDTFETLSDKNANDKLRMVSRINHNYGQLNKSLENYCNIQSLEAQAEKVDATAPANKGGDAAKKTGFGSKVANFFKTIGKKLKDFFVFIWNMIKKCAKAIGDFFVRMFKGKENSQEEIKLGTPIQIDKNVPAFVLNGIGFDAKTTVTMAKELTSMRTMYESSLQDTKAGKSAADKLKKSATITDLLKTLSGLKEIDDSAIKAATAAAAKTNADGSNAKLLVSALRAIKIDATDINLRTQFACKYFCIKPFTGAAITELKQIYGSNKASDVAKFTKAIATYQKKTVDVLDKEIAATESLLNKMSSDLDAVTSKIDADDSALKGRGLAFGSFNDVTTVVYGELKLAAKVLQMINKAFADVNNFSVLVAKHLGGGKTKDDLKADKKTDAEKAKAEAEAKKANAGRKVI